MGDLAVCLDCEHVHGPPSIAYICVGCPCPHYPVGQDDSGRWLDCGGCGEPWPCYTAVRHDDPPTNARPPMSECWASPKCGSYDQCQLSPKCNEPWHVARDAR